MQIVIYIEILHLCHLCYTFKYTIFLEGVASFTRLSEWSMAQKLRTPVLDKLTSTPPTSLSNFVTEIDEVSNPRGQWGEKTTVTCVSTAGPE